VPRPAEARSGSVSTALADATAALAEAGCDTPRLDAELLLAAALGLTRTALFMAAAATVDDGALTRLSALLARRVAREPVAYILGVRHFRRLSLAVDGRVLIPRPETELLVEAAVSGVAAGARVADVGTGSGAVALALKDERPDLVVTGIDVSEDALAVAAANARRLELDVTFVKGDLLAGDSYEAVLANLPYVPDGAALQPEISQYEPQVALFGGADGLEVMRRLAGELTGSVSFVALEHGEGQAAAVCALLSAAGFADTQRLRDLAGIERVVVGRR
jgi:release factor glutamine methyltransferase